jgi:hypothetical protein
MDKQPSKIPKFDLTASSDLLSRLSSFLPQLQAANEQLAQQPNSDSIVDANLAIEEDGDSDDENKRVDSEKDGGESDGEEQVDKPQQPTIQLRLAVGDIDENPGISWLADQDDSPDGEEEASPLEKEDEITHASPAESTISSLLGKPKQQTRPKGPLITEMN